jgi:hypothetical protein
MNVDDRAARWSRPRTPALNAISLVFAVGLGANTPNRLCALFKLEYTSEHLNQLIDSLVRHGILTEDPDTATLAVVAKGR